MKVSKNTCCQNPSAGTMEVVKQRNLPAGPTTANKTWQERVNELEQEGLTTSDAQGAVDVEIMEGWRPSDYQPWMNLPLGAGCSYEEMGKWLRKQEAK